MPLFMGVHTRGDALAPGGSAHAQAHAQAHAHSAGPKPRGHHVHYLRYWVDEARGKVFCLIDAPDAGAPAGVHRRAYSLLAKEISDNQDDPARTDLTRFDTAEIYRVLDGE